VIFGRRYDAIKRQSNAARWLLLAPIILCHLAFGFLLAVAASLLNFSVGIQEAVFGASFWGAIHASHEIAPSDKFLVTVALATLVVFSTILVWYGLLTNALASAYWFVAFSFATGSLICLIFVAGAAWALLMQAKRATLR
jgi:hypothetical protein